MKYPEKYEISTPLFSLVENFSLFFLHGSLEIEPSIDCVV